MRPGEDKFRVGLVQTTCSLDPNENLEKAKWKVREAASQGAQVVCLQELFRSQYFCREENADLFALAESIPGPSTEELGAVAREAGVVIIASLFEKRAHGLYHNTAAILNEKGELAGVYRKMHIPDDPLYFEKFYFTPGDLGFRNFDTSFGRLGVLVCWISGIPRARVSRPSRARTSSSTRPLSAGILPKRPSTAPRSSTPGVPSSARTLSPTASTWRP